MKAYRILVHDDRDREPTVLVAEFARDERAQEYAHERLASSPHFESIEVWRDRVKLCHLKTAMPKAA